ncbi:MAG: DUF488 family protein [Gammaproteobacteria bacterium]|nr:DUF488 family protein [Gammaproteobacteria bacterium]
MKVYTIGFTKKSAEKFFGKLHRAGVKRIVDVRLNNVSQLAGFAKRNDLEYFARELCGAGYVHLPELAPTKNILDEYKKNKSSWEAYEKRFMALMEQRRIEDKVPKDVLEEGCLLCSEDKPHHCHRRLVAEYLNAHWGNVEVEHLE